METQEEKKEKNEHVIDYTVNDEPQSTTADELTPTQILSKAGIDPNTNYLVEIRGNGKEKVSFKDNPDELIKMREHLRFISVSTGPKPVSEIYA